MKTDRQNQIRKRKNFLPTLIITIVLWLLTAGFIYFFDPESLGALPLFFALLFFSLLFTFSVIFASSRRGLLIALGLTIFILLRYLGIGNILNFLLIFGLITTIEIYFLKKPKK